MTIQRAWSATCADGPLRDKFANAVEYRITQVDNCPGDAFAEVKLVDDFVARCDALFSSHSPENVAVVQQLADDIDTADLYDLYQVE